MKKPFFILIAACFCACNNPSKPAADTATESSNTPYAIKTGGNKLIKVAGKYNVWTKKVGDGKIKVLLLHGGPGFSHDYMECFEDFLPKEGIEFYYYDQLGCGNSDAPADTSLWNIPRYVEEVEEVRKGLGLDNFYILGHSWGGMLAMEYLHKYQSHVKGAVLSNMTAGIKGYVAYAAELKKKFFTPRDITVFDSLDRLKQYDSPQYNDLLMNKLYTQVICRLPLENWPEPLWRAFKKANHTIYIQMQGVDEFHVTGNFKGWEFWDKLQNIKTPTLVLGGVHDEMNPEDMKKEGRLLPNSRTYLCPNGSHMSMYDDQQNYFKNLITFLKDVDAGTFTADKK
ncbi:proline iminopeptidase-family hydrolase [Mucilaginibacter gossypii]|uniref:Proline iminopeptidase n=1 Tax=Mucilaginibacter gossypii TaxID=551996 RepID=A0A1G8J054_9SPHI|nr:proline iminopeptidase-family hydrolase [Mucilaginibacter gossypii]SDI24110.1 proline iminopeptidase [Mucilaginibacter gossypii]